MKGFIILAILGVAAAASLPSAEMPRLPKVNIKHSFDMVKAHGEKALAHVNAMKHKHTTQDWTTCSDAFATWTTISEEGTCSDLITDAFTYDASISQAEFDTSLDAFCDVSSLSCSSRIEGALSAIALECADIWTETEAEEDSFIEAVRQFISVVRIPCTTLDATSTYLCAKDFKMASTMFNGNGSDDLTVEQLDALCKPCVAKMFQVFAEFSSEEDAIRAGLWINLVCLSIDDEYCFIFMEGAFEDDSSSSMSSSESEEPTEEEEMEEMEMFLEALCHPCVKLVIDYLSVVYNVFDVDGTCNALAMEEDCTSDMDDVDCEYNDGVCEAGFDSAETTGMLALLCGKNENNELCIIEFFTAVRGFDDDDDEEICGPEDEMPPSSCPTACANAVNGLAADIGCCAGYIDDYMNMGDDDSSSSSSSEDAAEIEAARAVFILETCASPNFDDDYPECPMAGVSGSFSILNFASDYFNDHKDDIIAWIILDIALSGGVSEASITVVATDVDINADGEVTVQYYITVTNNDEADYVSITVGSNMNLAKTSSEVPPSGKNDFTAALEVANVEATAESFSADDWEAPEDDASSARTLAASAVVALVPTLMLL